MFDVVIVYPYTSCVIELSRRRGNVAECIRLGNFSQSGHLICAKETNRIVADCYKQCFRYDEWFFHTVHFSLCSAAPTSSVRLFVYRSIKYESSSLSTWMRECARATVSSSFSASIEYLFATIPNYSTMSRRSAQCNETELMFLYLVIASFEPD